MKRGAQLSIRLFGAGSCLVLDIFHSGVSYGRPLLLARFLLSVAASCHVEDVVNAVAKNFLALNCADVLGSVSIKNNVKFRNENPPF